MHKITSQPITIDSFEIDDYSEDITSSIETGVNLNGEQIIIDFCEELRKKYLETKDKRYWKELIRWLPESFLQMRTVTLNYENLLAICSKSQRRFHKLNEWSGQDNPNLINFISWARTLPYAQDFIFIDEEEDKDDRPEIAKRVEKIIKSMFSWDKNALCVYNLEEFEIELKEIGMSLYNADGSSKNINEVMSELSNKYNEALSRLPDTPN